MSSKWLVRTLAIDICLQFSRNFKSVLLGVISVLVPENHRKTGIWTFVRELESCTKNWQNHFIKIFWSLLLFAGFSLPKLAKSSKNSISRSWSYVTLFFIRLHLLLPIHVGHFNSLVVLMRFSTASHCAVSHFLRATDVYSGMYANLNSS